MIINAHKTEVRAPLQQLPFISLQPYKKTLVSCQNKVLITQCFLTWNEKKAVFATLNAVTRVCINNEGRTYFVIKGTRQVMDDVKVNVQEMLESFLIA